MGDVDNGDMVDKRLWEDGDEKEQEQAGKNDDGQAAKVADKSNLDYEAGEHEENDCSKDKDGARRPDAGEPGEPTRPFRTRHSCMKAAILASFRLANVRSVPRR